MKESSQEFCGCFQLVPTAKTVTCVGSLLNMPTRGRTGRGRKVGGEDSGIPDAMHMLDIPFLVVFLRGSQTKAYAGFKIGHSL